MIPRDGSRALAILVALPALAAAAGPPPSFDPDRAAPYFAEPDASPSVKEAMRALRGERFADAARGFAVYLREGKHGGPPDREQATFLEAYALSRAGRFAEAADLFDGLVRSYPLLADHERLYAARALLAAGQAEAALARARLVDKSSPLDAEARFVRGEALRQLGLLPEAEREYRGYLEAYPSSWREGEASCRLASLLEERARRTPAAAAEPLAEAKRLYRAVYVHLPTESWAKQAHDRLLALDGHAPDLGGPELLARGLALFDQMRNEDSEATLHAALQKGGLDATQQCAAAYHLAQSVFKERDRPRAAALFDDAVATCEKSKDAQAVDLHAKALYQGARCHAAKDELATALHLYSKLEEQHPAHSYADDARLRMAEILDAYLDRLKAAKAGPPEAAKRIQLEARFFALAHMTEFDLKAGAAKDDVPTLLALDRDRLLASIVDKYPTGDQGGEALFRLAFHAWRDGRPNEARAILEKELSRFPREDGWWEAGRTLYWLGRVAERQTHFLEAREFYSRCAREYPLSYYTLAALNRLRERAPDEEKKLVAELAAPAATQQDLAWRFSPSEVFASPAFRRGVELARLGLGSEARRELAAAGIHVPARGARVDSPAAEELLWVAAVLYDRAGEWSLSHSIPRHVLTAYAARWPVSENRKRWLLSYPRGYADLIVENAAKNGQPAALQFAIVREESAFDPSDESFANAVGLTQLTQAPAKRFAQGLPYSREALRDPVINVTIGARELGDLWKRTHGAAALAIAGYNAGDGAVRRWLRASPPGTTLDEFVESIPYDETRGYTKRVLGSWFAYHWLYEKGDPVPSLPQSLPSIQ